MIRQEDTILIHCPADVVFGCAANAEQEFLTGKGSIIRPIGSSSIGAGSTFQVLAPVPRRGMVEAILEITTYMPNLRLEWKQTAPSVPRLGTIQTMNYLQLEPVDTGTRVTLTIQVERTRSHVEHSLLFRPFSWLAMLFTLPPGIEDRFMSLMLRPLIRGTLAELKRNVEMQSA